MILRGEEDVLMVVLMVLSTEGGDLQVRRVS
jgi:hypothetical protein